MINLTHVAGMKSASAVVVSSILMSMPGIVISNKLPELSRMSQLSFCMVFEFAKGIGIKYIEIWEGTG